MHYPLLTAISPPLTENLPLVDRFETASMLRRESILSRSTAEHRSVQRRGLLILDS